MSCPAQAWNGRQELPLNAGAMDLHLLYAPSACLHSPRVGSGSGMEGRRQVPLLLLADPTSTRPWDRPWDRPWERPWGMELSDARSGAEPSLRVRCPGLDFHSPDGWAQSNRSVGGFGGARDALFAVFLFFHVPF
jgi:hypothetical protein